VVGVEGDAALLPDGDWAKKSFRELMKKEQNCRKEYKLRYMVFELCRRGPERMVRRVLLMIALAAVVFSVIGCKTVQGIGGDITWLGKKGEQAIQR